MTGSIFQRESFLDHIASQLGRDRKTLEVERPNWKHQVNTDLLQEDTEEQLLAKFKEHCNKIHTRVIETTPEQLAAAVKQLVSEIGGGPVLVSSDPRFAEYDLSHLVTKEWPAEEVVVSTWSSHEKTENIRLAEQANVVLTFSDYTLAESGTVVMKTRAGQGRAFHFLPKNYVVIIPRSSIVARITQAVQDLNRRVEIGEPVPSSINFISGPSNSADIEMNLVVGVHGPLAAYYVVV